MSGSSKEMFTVVDKVALVTGGGSGIGRATAKLLSAKGASVALTEQPGRMASAEAVAAACSALGTPAIAVPLDVTATPTILAVVDHVVKRYGRIDILVNNAGTQLLKPALDLDEDEYDQVMDVNLKGAFFCSQAVGQVMSENGGGVIVNVASQHGVVGNRNRAPYCASKAGLINLSRALAVEWADLGIRVNSISPTFVLTEHNGELLDSQFSEEIARNTPLGRPMSVEEVAAGILYLVSEEAAGITGHNLMIDGGWTAR